MIRGLVFSVFYTCFFLTVSARNPEPVGPFFTSVIKPLTTHSVYSSGWETVPSWQFSAGKGTFLATFSRQLPQISSSVLQEGVVLVFAKGYDFEEVSNKEEKPLGLPFYMASPDEMIAQLNAWTYALEEGKATIELKLPEVLKSDFKRASEDIRLRYFVVPPAFMQHHQLSAMAIRKMPYSQLSGLLGTTP
jgi:hypothetical protein